MDGRYRGISTLTSKWISVVMVEAGKATMEESQFRGRRVEFCIGAVKGTHRTPDRRGLFPERLRQRIGNRLRRRTSRFVLG